MYKMSSISHKQANSERTNRIGSLTQKYLLCLYDKHWGHRKGACGVSAGDFRDYAGCLYHLIAETT